MKFIVVFSLLVISRSNSDNSAYSWYICIYISTDAHINLRCVIHYSGVLLPVATYPCVRNLGSNCILDVLYGSTSTYLHNNRPAHGVNMAANFVHFVICFAFINLVISIFIQDTFIRCFYSKHSNNQLHYREMRTQTRSWCSIVCLPDGICTGFDFCPFGAGNRNTDGEHTCKLKNSTQTESCEAQDQYGISHCESYRRVSKRSVWNLTLRVLSPGK
jgi:hypothetical protein